MLESETDYNDYEYLQGRGETASGTEFDNPEYFVSDGDGDLVYRAPQDTSLDGPAKRNEIGLELEPHDTEYQFAEDSGEYFEELSEDGKRYVPGRRVALESLVDSHTLQEMGYQSFWDAVDSHSLYFEPAHRHWRQGQHLDRHYIEGADGERIVSAFERARVREVMRKLRTGNPEYYREKDRLRKAADRKVNNEKHAAAVKRAEEKDKEKLKARRKEANRRYYEKRKAREKLLKEQQKMLDNATGIHDNA